MERIYVEFLVKAIVGIPVVILILRFLFKGSIVMKVGILMLTFVILMASIFELKLLPINLSFPILFLIFAFILYEINRALKKPLNRINETIESISNGNLDIELKHSTQKNEIGRMNNSIMVLIEKLNEVIGGTIDSARILESSSQQLSSSSEQLSQGANEQASTVEEVSSTMEEITANIEQNTSNSQQTEKVSKQANIKIKDIANRSKLTLDANQKIASNISIINDIAFQTNILALNAAGEAGRAGEHGKGFAVVASEVRKLAEISKKAATEIATLAQEGLVMSEDMGIVMNETIPMIENTTNLVKDISVASVEQSNGVGQVNSAIQLFNDVTQQNAASSEEIAASAEELAAQASLLLETISYFKINQNKINE